MRSSERTVLVVSGQFVSDVWPSLSHMKTLNDIMSRHVIVVVTERSRDAPRCLLDHACLVDASVHYEDWWPQLTRLINDPLDGIQRSTVLCQWCQS